MLSSVLPADLICNLFFLSVSPIHDSSGEFTNHMLSYIVWQSIYVQSYHPFPVLAEHTLKLLYSRGNIQPTGHAVDLLKPRKKVSTALLRVGKLLLEVFWEQRYLLLCYLLQLISDGKNDSVGSTFILSCGSIQIHIYFIVCLSLIQIPGHSSNNKFPKAN